MTSAAAPAVNGEASLVPPLNSMSLAAPESLVQSEYIATSAEHSAQFRSPGATRSIVLPAWVNPPEERSEMLSSA